MKKIFMAVALMATMAFASCGNATKNTTTESVDATTEVVEEVTEAVSEAVENAEAAVE